MTWNSLLLCILLWFAPFHLVCGQSSGGNNGSNGSNGNSNNAFSIYTLPPFAVTLLSSWSITGQDLAPTATDLQSIAQIYLFDYYHASKPKYTTMHTSTSTSTSTIMQLELHSVDLQVSIRRIDDKRVWAELYGNVAFLESESVLYTSTMQSKTQDMQDLLKDWIASAFDETTGSLSLFQHRLIDTSNSNMQFLKNLEALKVTFDTKGGPPLPITIRAPTKDTDTAQWSSIELILLGTLLFFLAAAAFVIYAFVQADRYKYRRDEEFESLQREHDDLILVNQQQRPSILLSADTTNAHSYDQNYTGTPQGSDAIPFVNSGGSRRYMDPASPLQILFGASHLHSERNVMEQQHHHHTPMASKNGLSNNDTTCESPLTTWFRTMGIMDVLLNNQSKKDQELPFVYRDFPRHDGTPCLMYNPSKAAPAQLSPSVKSKHIGMGDAVYTPQVQGDTDTDAPMPSNSMHSTTSSKNSISSTNSLELFIDRLENLYQLKQKQYTQRMEMERERRERRQAKQRQKKGTAVTACTPAATKTTPNKSTPTVVEMTVLVSPDAAATTPLKSNVTVRTTTPAMVSRSKSNVTITTPAMVSKSSSAPASIGDTTTSCVDSQNTIRLKHVVHTTAMSKAPPVLITPTAADRIAHEKKEDGESIIIGIV